jgi:DNA primase
LQQKLPTNAEEVAWDSWNTLERRELERRRDSLASRMQGAKLSNGEVIELQKQILDLQKRLTDIARPFPRPAE